MTRRTRFLLFLIVLGGLGLRVQNLDWGLPEVFEEATPVREAVEFWGVPGTSLDLNPHFFKYPSLTFYAAFAVQVGDYFAQSLAGNVQSLNDYRQLLNDDFGRSVLQGRWLMSILGALLAIPCFILARRMGAGPFAWFAAIAAVAVPLGVKESQLVGPDIATALFVGAALAAAVKIAETGERAHYLWCGLWLGLAASAKYPGAMVFIAMLVAHSQWQHRQHRNPLTYIFSSHVWQGLFVAGLVFAATSPYVFLDVKTFLSDLAFERRHMELGHLGREGGRAWLYYLGGVLPQGWTPVLIGLAGVGLLGGMLQSRSRVKVVSGLAFLLLMLFVLSSWRMAAPRYALPLLPILCASAALGLSHIFQRVPQSLRSPVLGAALAVLALSFPVAQSWSAVSHRAKEDSRLACAAWLLENTEEGETILTERYGPELEGSKRNVLYLPFHGVTPHIYDPAYSPVLYSTFDVIVLSSGVSDRYLAHAAEYPAQVAFYKGLDRGFREVKQFPAGEYLGPTLRVLRRQTDVELPDLSGIPKQFFEELQGNRPLAEYFSQLGSVLVRQGNEDLGLQMLAESVEMDRGSARTLGNLGAIQLRLGRYEDALLSLRRAAELDPKNPQISYNLGTLFHAQGEVRQASEHFRSAISKDPAFETAYISLGRALVEDVKYNEARLVLREFLHRFPRSPNVERVNVALKELATMGPGRP